MTKPKGQSLVELALCAPIVMLLAVGATASGEVADAHAGLEGATQAAAAAAARGPDPASAKRAANLRFYAMLGGYPVQEPVLRITLGAFNRTDVVTATASGFVDIGWASFVFLPRRVSLESRAVVHLESWRTHQAVS